MVTQNTRGFTLVEMMMTLVIVSFMFVAVNSMLVMTMKRQLVNSYTENEEQKCQRAALEINGYIRLADTIQLIDSGGDPIVTGSANILRARDAVGGLLAEFEFVPGVDGADGVLWIHPGDAADGVHFTYSDQILPVDVGGNVFTWADSGFIDYSFNLSLDSGVTPYTGLAKPNL